MITVEGGFAKVFDVKTEHDENAIKIKTFVQLTYGSEKIKTNLINELRKFGFIYSTPNASDVRFKISLVKIWEVIDE